MKGVAGLHDYRLLSFAVTATNGDLGKLNGKTRPQLVEAISNAGVTTFVAHDLDLSGFGICHTLGHDMRRYAFGTLSNVIDLGLHLADAQVMGLESESHQVQQDKDPKLKLKEHGATPEELDFLVREKFGSGKGAYWECQLWNSMP
jgi:hypothetical protein